MDRFDPPGFVDDLTDEQKDKWSTIVSDWLDAARAGTPANNDGPREQFFNSLNTLPDADQAVKIISWNAFPRQVRSTSLSDKHRWRRADASRMVQDEYCEWSVERDAATQKIVRVTFTCEGPEYWENLAIWNPDKVLELYREFISPSVQHHDLFPNGVYNKYNRFNNSTTNGVMHLIQGANSLWAEIELGAAATIRRMYNGQELTDAQELIECSRYGQAGRNSDPFIGEQVNALARLRADITLNNPIGLYLHEFNPVGWSTPDNEDPRTFWKYVRGNNNYFVRAVFEVPTDRGYVVGDIKIGGRPLEFGAQIADFITIKLEGLACRFGQSTVTPVAGCHAGSSLGAPTSMLSTAAGSVPTFLPNRYTNAVTNITGTSRLLATIEPTVSVLNSPNKDLIALPVEAAPLAAKLDYPKLPKEDFIPRLVSGKIVAYASPDSTYAITKKLLDSAQHSIVIGIYDFTADYVKNHLKQAMRRGVKVSLLLQTQKMKEEEKNRELRVFNELKDLGANCVKAAAANSDNPIVYFDAAHEKIIVVDEEIVMIQSGNWSENSIPYNESDGINTGQFDSGNRDMGLAIESRELAVFFANLVARDMRLAQGIAPDAEPRAALVEPLTASSLFFEAAPSSIPRLFPSLTIQPSTPVRVTPIVTPENFYPFIKDFLLSATRSIRIEQQYIRGHQKTVRELLDKIKEARDINPNLDIRIIVSPKYLEGKDLVGFVNAMYEYHLDFDDNYRYLSTAHFVHCHNKLIIVDDERVLLGSQNWSTTGIMSNREASLLVEHAGIAAYFSKIFDEDWKLSEPTQPLSDGLLKQFSSSDFAEGNLVQSTVRDYEEV